LLTSLWCVVLVRVPSVCLSVMQVLCLALVWAFVVACIRTCGSLRQYDPVVVHVPSSELPSSTRPSFLPHVWSINPAPNQCFDQTDRSVQQSVHATERDHGLFFLLPASFLKVFSEFWHLHRDSLTHNYLTRPAHCEKDSFGVRGFA